MNHDPTEALGILSSKFHCINIHISMDCYVLFGSMPMWFKGLRPDGVGDLDVFVRKHVYEALLATGEWKEQKPRASDPPFLELETTPPIHIFYDWEKRSNHMDIERCFEEAEYSADGWRYAPLTEVVKWKLEARREKDIDDLLLINDYWERIGQ